MRLCVRQDISKSLQDLAQGLDLTPDELLDEILGPQRLVDLEFIEAIEDLNQKYGVELCLELLKSGT